MNLTEAQIKLNSPTDIITTVPLLLGFHPECSLVVVGLHRFEVRCTFRVDLPGSADHIEHLYDLTPQLCRNECDAAVLIVYGEREVAEASLARTALRLHAAGIEAVDRLRVTDGRWFSLGCAGACCPAEGLPVPETSPASCEVAVAGAHALDDRTEVAAQLDPAEPSGREAVARAVEAALRAEAGIDWAEQRGRDLHAVDHWLGAGELPGFDDIATLGLALGDVDVRDYALRRINSGRFPGNRTDLWVWLARHLAEDLAAPAATVAGFAAYRNGNGVLAAEALERALQWQPNYRLAQMLMASLQAGIPPGALSRIGGGLPCGSGGG
ncbi:DUF4192 domain-containing protein [Glycomyces xiaoerkulensis]|uniref:DUF4192 domain-containing protein n=1 Tax=Glycomyces xiaoerkulensis TaxID=2038139 RepID=UPI0012FFEE2B|nr:DUF4192 domain-containing protein [Glycomyces xiaoerkulensis]